jgi:protein-tyrosine phosphatase
MKRQILGSALVFLAALPLLGCAGMYPTPQPPPPLGGVGVARFDRVSKDIYRSAQPSLRELIEVQQRYGIKSVLKLNRGSDPAPPGISVVNQPLDALSEPSHEQLEEILRAIDQAPKPLLIHCTHGEDRTGLIVALYKMSRLGVPLETAYTDMMRRGFHPYSGVFKAWVREVKWDRPESLGRSAEEEPERAAAPTSSVRALPGAN